MTKFQEERIYKIFEKINNDEELKHHFNINLRNLHSDENARLMLLNAYEAYEHSYVLAKKQIKKLRNENI
jgi:hypothetical protein